ncbi:Methylesterase 4 [Cardamine amara subsp. amara]|uniref:Methylesterase 4 n=1 Tax=Cardamine amara subsp. amara TaxID=228776 RepID=A0ABD1BWS5_CARAN
MEKNKTRFVFVHGVCHGAWSWYKVKPILEEAGHSVTAIDLAASGISTSKVEEIQSLKDYSKPLLEVLSSFGPDEKVILVAHSMGGIPAALAADIFPSKIAAIVFLTATMPDTKNPPAYVFEKFVPPEEMMDTVFHSYETHDDGPLNTVLLGPKFMAKNLYQLSPIQDLELAKMLVRENPALATNNIGGTKPFSEERYGSVTRIYIICGEDNFVRQEYQRLIINNFRPKQVMEIKDADHMPMFSKPQELCACLLEIADKY